MIVHIFVPTNFVNLNRYHFLHKKYYTKNVYNLEVMISKTLYQNLSFKVLSCNVQSFEKDKS